MTQLTQKGDWLEAHYAARVHAKGIPILVSAALLRQRGMGQVDLAVWRKGEQGAQLELYEVKCGGFISGIQRRRLKHSAVFLAQVFKAESLLFLVSGQGRTSLMGSMNLELEHF